MCTRVAIQRFSFGRKHLLELIRYIVLNPVRAEMVPVADQWPWSSYQATAGLVESPSWLSTEGTTAIFGGGAEGRHGFMQFVRDGIGAPSCWRHLKNQIYLGDSAFVSHAPDRIAAEAPGLSEVPIRQRSSHPAPMARWASRCPEDPSLRDLTERNQAIIDSFASGHATMRAIGEHFGIHYSRVSRIVGAAERARGKT